MMKIRTLLSVLAAACVLILYGVSYAKSSLVEQIEHIEACEKKTPLRDALRSDMHRQLDALNTPIMTNGSPLEQTVAAELENSQLPRELRQSASPEGQQILEKLAHAHEQKTVQQQQAIEPDPELVEFYFEDADLENLLKQIELIYNVQFITDDMITPLPNNGRAIKGNKISFKTNNPLTRDQAWNLFIKFMNIAGFALVPGADQEINGVKIYRVKAIDAARKSAITSYLGVQPETLPDNDNIIRYLYFLENGSLETIVPVIDALRSSVSEFLQLAELNAFLLIDKAYNIKSLMKIVKELDTVTLPQSMSILKLKRTDAEDVKKLYDSITQTSDKSITARLFPSRKQPTALYFPENTRMIAEPRTNALILLGPQDAIQKIEEFIITHIDVDLEKPYTPLRVYTLKYADAKTVATLMNELVKFGSETAAGKAGGVRAGDKYLRDMAFTPAEANRLVIKGAEEDYVRALEIIKKLDKPQPQIAIEVLILSVDGSKSKALGTQIRTKRSADGNGPLGDNVKFQTSGIRLSPDSPSRIVTDDTGPGVNRLLGDIVDLATGAVAGNTVVQLGVDAFGGSVWGIFNALQTVSDVQVLSNPFLIATNKKEASISIGELRRVLSAQVVGGQSTQNSFTNDEANLEVTITPQINSDGMIVLKLNIKINAFTDAENQNDATKSTKEVDTTTIVADKEVIALGGLIKNTTSTGMNKTPLLGDIPILGWLFKAKDRTDRKNHLLILISTQIIKADDPGRTREFTQAHVDEYHDVLREMHDVADYHDPVNRVFFDNKESADVSVMDDYLFNRQGEGRYSFEKIAEKCEHGKPKHKYNKQKACRKCAADRRRARKAKRKKKKACVVTKTKPTEHRPRSLASSVKNWFSRDKSKGELT